MARTSFRDNVNGTNWKPGVNPNGTPRMEGDPSKDFIEGHLICKKENVGTNQSNVYQIKIFPDPKVPYTGFGSDEELVNVWGSKSSGSNNVLDKQMDEFLKSPIGGVGAWCRIEFNKRVVKNAAKNKDVAALQSADLPSIYTVIGDDEIAPIKIDAPAAYKSNDTNVVKKETPVAAKPVVAAAPLAEVPASIDETDESDDLPF